MKHLSSFFSWRAFFLQFCQISLLESVYELIGNYLCSDNHMRNLYGKGESITIKWSGFRPLSFAPDFRIIRSSLLTYFNLYTIPYKHKYPYPYNYYYCYSFYFHYYYYCCSIYSNVLLPYNFARNNNNFVND